MVFGRVNFEVGRDSGMGLSCAASHQVIRFSQASSIQTTHQNIGCWLGGKPHPTARPILLISIDVQIQCFLRWAPHGFVQCGNEAAHVKINVCSRGPFVELSNLWAAPRTWATVSSTCARYRLSMVPTPWVTSSSGARSVSATRPGSCRWCQSTRTRSPPPV